MDEEMVKEGKEGDTHVERWMKTEGGMVGEWIQK